MQSLQKVSVLVEITEPDVSEVFTPKFQLFSFILGTLSFRTAINLSECEGGDSVGRDGRAMGGNNACYIATATSPVNVLSLGIKEAMKTCIGKLNAVFINR